MAAEGFERSFTECLVRCAHVLSPRDHCRLRYLFGSLLTESELGERDNLTSFYNLLKNKMGVQNSQLYVLYALEHVSCYNEREDLRTLVSFPDPQSGVEIDKKFTMRELIVDMDKQLTDDEFKKLVEYVISCKDRPLNADNFPADKRTDFYSKLKTLKVISIDNYQDVMSEALRGIQRIDLSEMQPEGPRYCHPPRAVYPTSQPPSYSSLSPQTSVDSSMSTDTSVSISQKPTDMIDHEEAASKEAPSDEAQLTDSYQGILQQPSPFATKSPTPAVPLDQLFKKWKCLKSIVANVPKASETAIKTKLIYLHEKFKHSYRGMPEIPVSEWFWPKLDRTRYVTLGLITNESYTELDHFTHSSLRNSSVDEIPSRKIEISYGDAFPQELEQMDFKILISGRPGSGKTVLLTKLCKEWADGNRFRNVPVVILVRLRELNAISTDIGLSTIIKQHFDANVDEVTLFIEEQCKGEGFCFALDGLDEYPHLNAPGDFITGLIRGSYLPKAAVVITSRPTHSHLVKHLVQKHIEIIGFLPPQIQEYIHEHYKDKPKEGEELTAYIKSRPNIMGMCYLPLHLAMVIFVHKTLRKKTSAPLSLLETETGVYWHFMKHTVIRHAKREYEEEDILIENLKDFEEFLSELSQQDQRAFTVICKLAFQSRLNSNLVFSTQDIKKEFKMEKGSVKDIKQKGFGILSNYKMVTADGETSMFSFQHLTIQEFLAAYYLQLLPQKERFGEIVANGSKRHMREVWKFFYGLMMMRDPDEHYECFRVLIQLSSKNRDGALFLIKCAFESQPQSVRACQQLMTSLNGSVDVSNISLDTSDCLAIGHVIARSHKELGKLTMNYCHVGPEGVQALQQQLTQVHQFEALKKMQIRSQLNPVGDQEGGRDLIELLKKMEKLDELRLYGNQLSTDRFRNLEPVIARMTNLRILVLTKNSLGSDAGKYLNVVLAELRQLIQFYVSYNPLTTEGLEKLCPGLLNCTKLRRLGLRGCELDGNAGYQLVKILVGLKELKQLELYKNHLGNKGVLVMCEALPKAPSLQQISFTKNDIEDEGACAIAEYVRNTTTLDQIRIYYNEVSSIARKAFYDAAKFREENGLPYVKYAI